MSISRIAQFGTSPLLANYAITASQSAIRPIGKFLSPVCPVGDITFRYKVYSTVNRYRVPNTRRVPGAPATMLGFSADDAILTLEPNALDVPIPNANQLNDDALQFAMMEGISCLADASALALENEIVALAKAAALASPRTMPLDFGDDGVDPVAALDAFILYVRKAAKNGAPVKVLFGATKWKKFRNNRNVLARFIVASGAPSAGGTGLKTVQIEDVPGLLMTKPKVDLSFMVIDDSAPGQAENIQFLLDDLVLIFASSDTPTRMDASFMKTFSRNGMEGLFKSGAYTSEDERDETVKMDWTALPKVTNSAAVAALT